MQSIFAQGPLGIVSLFLVLGLIVVVHELGHYLAGRAFGAAAESFSVGFGKPIFEMKDKRNTRWRLNWIPFGGFVQFVGESNTVTQEGEPAISAQAVPAPIGKKYMDLTVGQRSIISAAGPVANFVLAIFLFALVAFGVGKPIETITIAGFAEGPAEAAGFEVGDQLYSINGKVIRNSQDVLSGIGLSTGVTLNFIVNRDGGEVAIDVVPVRVSTVSNLGQRVSVGQIGISIEANRTGYKRFGPMAALGEGVQETGATIARTGIMLGRLVTGREPITQLSGPVGIGDLTRRAVSATLEQEKVPLGDRLKAVGWLLLQISAFVSVGIGLVNLLPLPVLDGGHLVFNAYEAFTGSILPEKIQAITMRVGVVFLLSVAAIVTLGDIVKTGILQGFGG